MNMRKYRSNYKPRSLRKIENRNKQRLIWSIIISVFLIIVIFQWVLPSLIGQLTRLNRTSSKKITSSENVELAPPVLNIPYEATNSSTIKIRGYATPQTKVQIYLDDSLINTQTSDSEGNFTTDPVDLSLGTNNIYGKTIDDNKKESLPSKTIQVIYNNDKPKLEIKEPEDNKEIKGGDKKVTIQGVTDPDDDIRVNGAKVIVNSDGSFSTTVNLNDGDNNINITAGNSVGNTTSIDRKVKYTPN